MNIFNMIMPACLKAYILTNKEINVIIIADRVIRRRATSLKKAKAKGKFGLPFGFFVSIDAL